MKQNNWRSFTEARKFVHSLKFKNRKEWEEYKKSGKKPGDIPASPNTVYKNKGWEGMGDWLGTGKISPSDRKFRSYDEARKFARKLGLKSKNEWFDYVKLRKHPIDIPNDPRASYKNKGWIGWGDFLGTGRIANQNRVYLSAKDARITIKKIAKDVFGGKPFTPKDWADAHKAGKIPANLPRSLRDSYNPDRQKKKSK